MKTYNAKPNEIEKRWFIVDASKAPLGRMATRVAEILQGKNKPTYTPHVDTGDYVIVINAEKAILTGNKLNTKLYYRHTGWVGGLVTTTAKDMIENKPCDVIKFAVKGMLPKSTLGRNMLSKLKVHKGEVPEHAYKAQKAEVLDFND
jgi:large subunit ribosomal protein L13